MPEKKAKRLWIHAASLGEFEQGRPVIEAFRQQFPDWQIVLTFFSPSGYEIRKNYAAADFVGYLPADTAANSRDFLEIVQPDIAIFIKYEFWYHYLSGLKQRGIPVLLISALFRPDHIFFKPWGGLWRTMLAQCTHIFVQNAPSFQLLQHIGFQNITIAGDTRIDRVVHLAAQAAANEVVAAFSDGATVLIAGSTWPADEALLLPAFERVVEQHADYKLLLAPHEPTPQHLRQLLPRLPSRLPYCLYSQATVETARQAKILIIDNIGMLNTLYRYGQVAYIGGGFGKGIHNTLEPAAFGLPVVFGPRYQKFEEARAFVAQKGAFPVENEAALTQILLQLAVADARQAAAVALSRYLQAQKGATAKIMNYLEGLITA
jgi:3-deoxy-D-manno-octulosonic-acid transferase